MIFTVLTKGMDLIHWVETASLRSRSRHIETYTILPFLFSFVSSKRITGLFFFLASFLSSKASSNFKIYCLADSFETWNFLAMTLKDNPSKYNLHDSAFTFLEILFLTKYITIELARKNSSSSVFIAQNMEKDGLLANIHFSYLAATAKILFLVFRHLTWPIAPSF